MNIAVGMSSSPPPPGMCEYGQCAFVESKLRDRVPDGMELVVRSREERQSPRGEVSLSHRRRG